MRHGKTCLRSGCGKALEAVGQAIGLAAAAILQVGQPFEPLRPVADDGEIDVVLPLAPAGDDLLEQAVGG
jgi:hypothetical protein